MGGHLHRLRESIEFIEFIGFIGFIEFIEFTEFHRCIGPSDTKAERSPASHRLRLADFCLWVSSSEALTLVRSLVRSDHPLHLEPLPTDW